MSQTCTECGFPMDTPERAHAFIHHCLQSIAEHRGALRAQEEYAEELRIAGQRIASFLTANGPINYVADGDAWNARARFLQLLKKGPKTNFDEIGHSEIVTAQHDETGRMWAGPRDQLPPRYNVVENAIVPVSAAVRQQQHDAPRWPDDLHAAWFKWQGSPDYAARLCDVPIQARPAALRWVEAAFEAGAKTGTSQCQSLTSDERIEALALMIEEAAHKLRLKGSQDYLTPTRVEAMQECADLIRSNRSPA